MGQQSPLESVLELVLGLEWVQESVPASVLVWVLGLVAEWAPVHPSARARAWRWADPRTRAVAQGSGVGPSERDPATGQEGWMPEPLLRSQLVRQVLGLLLVPVFVGSSVLTTTPPHMRNSAAAGPRREGVV